MIRPFSPSSCAAAFAALLSAGCAAPAGELRCAGPSSARTTPPDTLDPFTLLQVDPERSEVAWGQVLLNQFTNRGERWVSLLDGCARHAWWRASSGADQKITRARFVPGREAIRYSEYTQGLLDDTGKIVKVSLRDPERVVETRALQQHHDWVVQPDGRLAFLSFEARENIWFDNGGALLASDVVRLTDEGDATAHDEVAFSLFDHFGAEPWWTCTHMKDSTFLPGHSEWTHTNSLVISHSEQAWYLLVRYWDAIVKVGFDGQPQWVLGGELDQFSTKGDTVLPRHGHTSEVWDEGMLVFDNGNHVNRPSRVVEYAIDQQARTVREVWSFEDPLARKSTHLGDALRLPGGNILVAWSPYGHLTEVTPGGDIVWEAQTDDEVGRLDFRPRPP